MIAVAASPRLDGPSRGGDEWGRVMTSAGHGGRCPMAKKRNDELLQNLKEWHSASLDRLVCIRRVCGIHQFRHFASEANAALGNNVFAGGLGLDNWLGALASRQQ